MVFQILCVNDKADVRELLDIVLAQVGCEFIAVESFAEGLQRSQRETFDLYLLYVCLPDDDGLDLAQQIRQRDRCVPIVIQSANAQSAQVQQGLTAGAQVYFTKPYAPFLLADTVAKLLDERESRTGQKSSRL